MITIDELKEAIKKGFIKGDTVNIVRRDDKIHDYVLPGEKEKGQKAIAYCPFSFSLVS